MPIKYGTMVGGVLNMWLRQITRPTVDLQRSTQCASAMAGPLSADGRGTVFADLRSQNQFAPVGWIDSGVGTPRWHPDLTLRCAVPDREALRLGPEGPSLRVRAS